MRLTRTSQGAFVIASLFMVAWLIGQAARDDCWFTGLCFYVPSGFLAICFALMTFAFALLRQGRRSLLALALALPPLVFVVFVENRVFRAVQPVGRSTLRLVHWNVGGALRHDGSQRVLAAQRADAYVLSEARDALHVRRFRDALGAPYEAIVFGGMAVIARGRVSSEGWLSQRNRSKVHAVRWEYAGHSIRLFVVDLPSDIGVWRAPLLERVMSLVQRDRPEIVVGDFNAPRRSRALSNLPPGYRHAYDAAGRGLGYTWPVPFPVYALDQCIVSPRVIPVRYELGTSVHSDHRFQVLDFTLRSHGE